MGWKSGVEFLSVRLLLYHVVVILHSFPHFFISYFFFVHFLLATIPSLNLPTTSKIANAHGGRVKLVWYTLSTSGKVGSKGDWRGRKEGRWLV